ncbi:MAG TPA: hypothetical protein PLD59_10685 [Tepidisphaeraceae bacterium]|nr:hypothetical protein [Tepidisphaeraceae bacterium]
MKRGWRKQLITAAMVCAGGVSVGWSQIQTASEPVARSGTTAPGTGLPHLNFQSPAMNNVGRFVFAGEVSGASSTTNQGVWAGTPGNLQLVAREGAGAPDAAGTGTVGTFNFLSLNPFENNPLVESQSHIAFFGFIEGPGISFGVNNTGIWSGTVGDIRLVARTGDAAPGVAGETFSLIREAAFISGAIVAFNGQTKNPLLPAQPAKSGVWAGTQGSIVNYALEGEQAGNAPAGVLYGFNNFTPTVNESGFVAFRTNLTDTDANPANNRGVFLGDAKANIVMIARGDDAVPGAVGDVRFSDFVTQPAINASEQIAFHASLNGADVTAASNTAIFRATYSSPTPTLYVREGDQAGGLASGVLHGEIQPAITMNSAGDVVFITDLTGTGVTGANDRAIFKGNGSIAPVARKGDQAPGTPSGTTFLLNSFTTSAAVNAGGQVAFTSRLTGTGVNVSNQTGLWALDPFNQLVKVAREGDTIDLDGISKTIGFGLSFHSISGGGEGRQTSFNNSSQLAYAAPFTDGTQAIINARVGGAARINANAPTLGASVGNSFFTGSPLPINTYGAVTGDIGYLKFVVVSGNQVKILLDFNGTNTAGAIAELNRHAAIYGYTVQPSSFSTFDALITYANASQEYFYWNFANIGDVSLVGVQMTPEPGTISLGLLGCLLLSRRRRRARGV